MIDVSVIIPVYNPGQLVRRCLDSILAQEGNYSYEVLLIDDGSSDDSSVIIQSYENPCFKLLHQENAGPACARNRGIELAQGRYLAFIDADDYWMPTFIQEMVAFLDDHSDCPVVSCGQKHLTVSGDIIAPHSMKENADPFVVDSFFDLNDCWDHVCTGSVMARTDLVKSIGGQRTDLRITEDLEFWALLAIHGKWGFVPKVLFVSDGTDTIAGREGWIKKMTVRWNNAPEIANWQNRLVAFSPELEQSVSYRKARGIVSRNLTYCQLLSGRIWLARQEAWRYGDYFTLDMIGKMMNVCKWSRFSWWIMCKFLQYREYHRF